MIRVLTAVTEQIDDTEAAAADIQEQLDCGHNLLKNSVGIISCHYEFALSGAVENICKALPFDTLGTVTFTSSSAKGVGQLQFTVMVLTSDDVRFNVVLSGSLKENPKQAIEEAYSKKDVCPQNADKAERPKMILVCAPFMLTNSGDDYVKELSRVSGNVPCFGTIALDNTADFRNCFSLCNGKHYPDKMALLFVYGNIQPRFFLATISQRKILQDAALITSSEGHILKEVNDRPVIEYFEKRGLTLASETTYAMSSLPFMLDYGDGTPPVARVFIAFNENKHALCAGAMPEGTTMYMGIFDKRDVLLTTNEAIQNAIAEKEQISGMIVYSCLSRSLTLGGEPFAEAEMVARETGGKFPFFMAYSGGEICPTHVDGDTAVNRFHNDTCVICVF